MVEVKEVKSLKERREFLNFPILLYKGNPNFVPPLFMDERKIFRKDYVYYDTCEAVYFNAYREGKMVGRISGILQKASNEKNGEKRVRFTRFDSINDREVSDALFEAVEKWALEKGMDEVVGPLGFSDLEREGLLIEGFDELSTYEEQYNAEYYQELIEARGYVKEVDWTESRIYPPENDDGSLKRIADKLMKRYDLHFGESKSVNDFLDRYADGFFEILDKSYDKLYGTVPFTPGMKKLMIDNFKLIIDLDHVAAILDNTGKVVCIGICFPSIAKAVQKSKGHLTPAALIRLLKAIKRPEIIDLGLIGVDPEWAMRGVSVAISAELERMLRQPGILYAETNLNLEDNAMIQNQWKRFREVKHKRRRSFVKKLKEEDGR